MGKRTATWVEIPCDNCEKLFEKKESRLKYSKRHYCSNDCSDQHKKTTMKGKNNHRFGTKSKDSTIKKQSAAMKERWKDKDYVDKVLSSREKAREAADYPFGWDPKSRDKRTASYIERYGVSHNWSDPDTRAKCIETTIEKYGKSPMEIAHEKIDFEKRRRTLIETMTGVSYEVYEQRLSDREKYYKKVRRLTEQQPLALLENYEKRGRLDEKEDAYHLDHIIPVCYGWLNNIPEEIIADISNLRFIPASDNIAKSSKHEGKLWKSDDEEIQD